MKWYFKLLILMALLIVGFFIGYFIPREARLSVVDQTLGKGDYWSLYINVFEAIATFLAVIVALFLNELRAMFKKVRFNVDASNIIEELETHSGSKKASEYNGSIVITNNGNINADGCEIYLEEVEVSVDGQIDKLNTDYEPIEWSKENTSVYIPINGKKILTLFHAKAPCKVSQPDQQADRIPAQIEFLGVNDPVIFRNNEHSQSIYKLTYSLTTRNAKPKRIKYTITWLGEWQDRLADFKGNLKVDVELL